MAPAAASTAAPATAPATARSLPHRQLRRRPRSLPHRQLRRRRCVVSGLRCREWGFRFAAGDSGKPVAELFDDPILKGEDFAEPTVDLDGLVRRPRLDADDLRSDPQLGVQPLKPSRDDPRNAESTGKIQRDSLVTQIGRRLGATVHEIDERLSPYHSEIDELFEVGRHGLRDANAYPLVLRPPRNVRERHDGHGARPEIDNVRLSLVAFRVNALTERAENDRNPQCRDVDRSTNHQASRPHYQPLAERPRLGSSLGSGIGEGLSTRFIV